MLQWQKCFLCSGQGRLSVISRFTKLFGDKVDKCPICQGKGQIAVKKGFPNSWFKKEDKNEG